MRGRVRLGLRTWIEKRQRLAKVVATPEDSVRIYSLCAHCAEKVEIIGQGTITKDREVYVI